LWSSLAASLLQTPVNSAVGFGGFVGSARVDATAAPDGEHLQVIVFSVALKIPIFLT
jgi:hypothetical protein